MNREDGECGCKIGRTEGGESKDGNRRRTITSIICLEEGEGLGEGHPNGQAILKPD